MIKYEGGLAGRVNALSVLCGIKSIVIKLIFMHAKS